MKLELHGEPTPPANERTNNYFCCLTASGTLLRRAMIHAAVACLFVLVVTSAVFAGDQVIRYDDGMGGQMWYRLYLPDNYDPSVSYPLTTFLHGNSGTNIRPIVDPDAQVERAPVGLVSAVAAGPHESILIAPQLEQGSWPILDNDRLIREAIDDVQATWGTDPQRRYLTGLSFGGYGTFHMLQEFPDYFAAGASIAGFYFPDMVTDPNNPLGEFADTVKDIPIWAFHGTSDPTVPVDASRVVVNALRAVGANVRYSELPLAPHSIWDQIYDAAQFPASTIFRLEVDTANQTFQVLADVDQQRSFGLHRFSIDLVGADTVRNLAPKSDFSPATGTSLGFTEVRTADDVFPMTAAQSVNLTSGEVVEGFGQVAGTLPGAGTGTGEVQPQYDAPLLLAEGTYTDLAALDFSPKIDSRNLQSVYSSVIDELSATRLIRFAASHTELYHDDELIYSQGDHETLYPWMFSQRLVPEPSSALLMVIAILALPLARRRVGIRADPAA